MKLGEGVRSLVFVLGALVAAQASALDVGLNFGGSHGQADISGLPGEFDVDAQNLDLTMRFCNDCRFIDYRLNVGYSAAELDYDNGQNDDAYGINVTNTVGFKAVNTSNFAFWMGASAYVGGFEVDGDRSSRDSMRLYGLGPTFGVDFRLPEGVTLSVELMARYLTADIDNDRRDDYDLEDAGLRLSILF
ncbi:hypothetical protein ACXYTJ_00770 [Gilvimarinus sp. F26214L]|uniref:hypothetical protein n=1 Tax=Gilvimarinus sp. DZF01 TaxID=3461371 RepID=UPI004045EACD